MKMQITLTAVFMLVFGFGFSSGQRSCDPVICSGNQPIGQQYHHNELRRARSIPDANAVEYQFLSLALRLMDRANHVMNFPNQQLQAAFNTAYNNRDSRGFLNFRRYLGLDYSDMMTVITDRLPNAIRTLRHYGQDFQHQLLRLQSFIADITNCRQSSLDYFAAIRASRGIHRQDRCARDHQHVLDLWNRLQEFLGSL